MKSLAANNVDLTAKDAQGRTRRRHREEALASCFRSRGLAARILKPKRFCGS